MKFTDFFGRNENLKIYDLQKYQILLDCSDQLQKPFVLSINKPKNLQFSSKVSICSDFSI
jgi:hypothetical protein